MPDKWGRVTGEDFFDIAKGLHGLAKDQEVRRDKDEINRGLAELEQSGELSDNLGISPRNRAAAQEAFAHVRVARQQGDAAELSRQQGQLETQYAGLLSGAKTPEEKLRVLSDVNPDSWAGMKALGQVYEQLNSNSELRRKNITSAQALGETLYTTVARPSLAAAEDMLNKGDEAQAANTLSALSRSLPLRGEYRVEKDDQGKVMLRRYHNERYAGLEPRTEQADAQASASPDAAAVGPGIGGPQAATPADAAGLGLGSEPQGAAAAPDYHTATPDVISVLDALKTMREMTSRDFAEEIARHYVANKDFNAAAIAKGGVMGKDGSGNRVRVLPLINPTDSSRQFAVFDASGRSIAPDPANTKRKTWTSDEFFNSGIQIFNKEQRALDDDERRVRTEERRTAIEGARLGLQREELGLRKEALGLRGTKARTPVEEGYAVYQKGADAAVQHDPLGLNGSPEEAGQKRLAEFTQAKYGRAMSLDELRGLSGGGGAGNAPQGEPAAPAATPAQSAWNRFKNK
jgi:hypothetical protein